MPSLNLARLFSRASTAPKAARDLPLAADFRQPLVARSTPNLVSATASGVVSLVPDSASPRVSGAWTPGRLAVNDRLWGEGFTGPGGEPEVLRLVRPLGAKADNRLLLVGAGAGGAVKTIADATKTAITALEADPALRAAAGAFLAQGAQKRPVKLQTWEPQTPRFPKAAHFNCLALEPMRSAFASVLLPALTAAIPAGGNVVVTNLIAIDPIDPDDGLIARWAALQGYDAGCLPSAAQVAELLDGKGMDLRIAEDISQRHVDQILYAWKQMMTAMTTAKPPQQEAAIIVAESEQWLLRRRLIETGRLRMMRWHTIRKF